MEEIIVKKLSGAIFGFKNNTKTASDVQFWLDKLKKSNAPLADDYEKKFIAAAQQRKATAQIRQAA